MCVGLSNPEEFFFTSEARDHERLGTLKKNLHSNECKHYFNKAGQLIVPTIVILQYTSATSYNICQKCNHFFGVLGDSSMHNHTRLIKCSNPLVNQIGQPRL